MTLSIKKIIFLISGIFIYGTSGLIETAQAEYPHSKMKADLFDIQFIMNNESFILQRVYFDGFKNAIRNCVFESASALWTIHYCHFGETTEESPWYLLLAGSFSIKETDLQLNYYLERESNIYRNIEYGSLAFTDYLSLMKMDLSDGETAVNAGWSTNRLPFLQNLARVQEQYIEKSLPADLEEPNKE